MRAELVWVDSHVDQPVHDATPYSPLLQPDHCGRWRQAEFSVECGPRFDHFASIGLTELAILKNDQIYVATQNHQLVG